MSGRWTVPPSGSLTTAAVLVLRVRARKPCSGADRCSSCTAAAYVASADILVRPPDLDAMVARYDA